MVGASIPGSSQLLASSPGAYYIQMQLSCIPQVASCSHCIRQSIYSNCQRSWTHEKIGPELFEVYVPFLHYPNLYSVLYIPYVMSSHSARCAASSLFHAASFYKLFLMLPILHSFCILCCTLRLHATPIPKMLLSPDTIYKIRTQDTKFFGK